MKWTEILRERQFLLIFSGILLAGLLYGSIALAQDGKPKVKLKLFVVPEKVACPQGYQDYDSGKKSDCDPLGMADIPRLQEKAEAFQEAGPVPPSKIKLNEDFLGILDTYRTAGKSTPEKRLSVVLLFEWDRPISANVSLKRIISQDCADFPDLSWSSDLVREKHWLHHERADAYLPGYKVEWILKVGDNTWDFHTGKK